VKEQRNRLDRHPDSNFTFGAFRQTVYNSLLGRSLQSAGNIL